MSRVGKKPVAIPSGVTASVEGGIVKVKGPKGALQLALHGDVEATMDKGGVKVDPRSNSKRARAMWGTYRTLVANLVTGVTNGFERRLEITGVGYRATVQGKNLQIALGYSHDIVYAIPDGITIVAPRPTEVVITGIDKQKVGQVAAEIRDFRKPEPYKGKGVNTQANTSSARKARRSDGIWPWRPSLIERCGGPRRCGGASGATPATARGCRYSAPPSTSMPR